MSAKTKWNPDSRGLTVHCRHAYLMQTLSKPIQIQQSPSACQACKTWWSMVATQVEAAEQSEAGKALSYPPGRGAAPTPQQQLVGCPPNKVVVRQTGLRGYLMLPNSNRPTTCPQQVPSDQGQANETLRVERPPTL